MRMLLHAWYIITVAEVSVATLTMALPASSALSKRLVIKAPVRLDRNLRGRLFYGKKNATFGRGICI